MNNQRLSRYATRLAGALALGGLLLGPTTASSRELGSSASFVAATAHCATLDTHAWNDVAGYEQGQDVACDLLSEEHLVQGRLMLHHTCPINGTAPCHAMFRIDADSGARWEGPYQPELTGTKWVLQGIGVGDRARAHIVLTIRNLTAASGWSMGSIGDDVVGRIITAD